MNALRLFNCIFLILVCFIEKYNCAQSTYLFAQPQSTLQQMKNKEYRIDLALVDKAKTDSKTLSLSISDLTIFNKTRHGINYSVRTSPLSIAYAVRDIYNYFFKGEKLPRFIYVSDWVNYFVDNIKSHRTVDRFKEHYVDIFTSEERIKILHCYHLYGNPAFITFIERFPEFEQHILASENSKLAIGKQLEDIGRIKVDAIDHIVYDVLPQQAKKVVANQEQREAQRQGDIIETREAVDKKIPVQVLYERQQENIKLDSQAPVILQVRNDAIIQTLGIKDVTMETIQTPIDDQSAQLITMRAVPREFFESCTGNVVQHQLHREFNDLLKEATLIKEQEIQNVLVENIIVGQEYNHLGKVSKGYAIADFCHGLIDFAKGFGKGIWHSLHDFSYAITHPKETVTNFKKFLAYVDEIEWKLLKSNFDRLHDLYELKQIKQLGDTELFERKKQQILASCTHQLNQVKILYGNLLQKVKTLSVEDIGEGIGRLTTDLYLQSRLFRAASEVSRFAKTKALDAYKKISKVGTAAQELAIATTEGIELGLAKEAAQGTKLLEHVTQEANALETKAFTSSKTPVGKNGSVIKVISNNKPAIIDGVKFTGHALDQMQARGIISPSAVLDVIRNPIKVIPGNMPETFVCIKDNLKVVVNAAGDIITVIPQ